VTAMCRHPPWLGALRAGAAAGSGYGCPVARSVIEVLAAFKDLAEAIRELVATRRNWWSEALGSARSVLGGRPEPAGEGPAPSRRRSAAVGLRKNVGSRDHGRGR
jgi:hypothetical protein